MNYIYPATLICDFYKVSHKDQYPKNTETIYSTFTPRSNKYFPIADKVVVFGIQAFVKKFLIQFFNDNFFNRNKQDVLTSATISHQYRKLLDKYAMETVGHTNDVDFQAHDFSMRGMASLESSKSSGAGHLLSFTGTDTIPAIMYHEEFYNANIENELVGASIPATEHSVMSAMTDADDRDEYEAYKRLITEVYPNGLFSVVSDTYDFWKVVGEVLPRLKDEIISRDGKVVIRPDSGNPVDIICGKNIEDFTNVSYCNTLEVAKECFYDELVEKVREETPHGEHGETDVDGVFKFEGKYYRLKIELEWNRYDKQYYFIDDHREKIFEEFQPRLSDLGLIEALWNIFGGTTTEKGYKLLDSHIGAIYGDSITIERAGEICKRLKEKGFASTNIVFGVGSYTFQYNTRDTFGFAMKATYAEIDGEERMLFKDPKTDDGTKRSQRGRVVVYKGEDGEIKYKDGFTRKSEIGLYASGLENMLETVFKDGVLLRDENLSEIRRRLSK